MEARLKNLKNVLPAILLAVAVACTGLTARQKSLLPAMKLAWPGVSTDVKNGIQASLDAHRIDGPTAAAQTADTDHLGAAVDAGDPIAMSGIAWKPLADAAAFGVDARVAKGEISTGVTGSLKERVKNFGDSLAVFLERR